MATWMGLYPLYEQQQQNLNNKLSRQNSSDNEDLHEDIHDKTSEDEFLDRSFAILKDRIGDNDLDMSDLSDQFDDLDETRDNSFDDSSIEDDSKESVLEHWNKKFDEWKTPKKKLFLTKLMQTINRTEEMLHNHNNSANSLEADTSTEREKEKRRERHRSSLNGRLIPSHDYDHPRSPKFQNSTEKVYVNSKKNSLSNDSLAFTLVYCSVFMVTLFYIGFKLTKKWRRQDEMEAENGSGGGHNTSGGYPCNHTLCREARERNTFVTYGGIHGPHNTAHCQNRCENCQRLNQPPPSYSKVCLDESDPPAYTEDMDRQCPCRRSQNSRASLCLFQNQEGNTSQESQDFERSASAIQFTGSSPRSPSTMSAPAPSLTSSTSATVHTAPSYTMQEAPSYTEFPKPGERKKAGHTRGSMENLPGTSNSVVPGTSTLPHHPIFTVDEEVTSDEDSSRRSSPTPETPILAASHSPKSTSHSARNSLRNVSAPSAPQLQHPLASLDDRLGEGNAQTEETEMAPTAECTPEVTSSPTAERTREVTSSPTADCTTDGAISTADCALATSAIENSTIIIEKSRLIIYILSLLYFSSFLI